MREEIMRARIYASSDLQLHHPETRCALITCFSSIHPAASSRRNCFTSHERLVKTYKIDVKKIKVSGNIEPKVKKPENEWECWKTPRDQVPFLLSSEPWEVCFPWKPDTYDLLHAHSHWTTEDTYISIDCIKYSSG